MNDSGVLERNPLALRVCSLLHCQRLPSIRLADKWHRRPSIFQPAQSHPHLNRDRSQDLRIARWQSLVEHRVLGHLPGRHRTPSLPQCIETESHLLTQPEEQATPGRTDGGDQVGIGCRREQVNRRVQRGQHLALVGKLALGLG